MATGVTSGALPEISHVPISDQDSGKFYEVVNGKRVDVSPMGAWASAAGGAHE